MCTHGVTAHFEQIGWMEIGENEAHHIIGFDGIFEKLATSEVCGIEFATIIRVDISDPLGQNKKGEAQLHYNLKN